MRKLLLALTARVKSYGIADMAIRYNPLLYSSIRAATRVPSGATVQTVEGIQGKFMQRVLNAARATSYGRVFAANYASWPVLKKNDIFTAPTHFTNPSAIIRVPASTGGTSGVPIALWRSLESIATEQAFIDQLLVPYNCSMRDSKMAVLRADSIKTAGDHIPPFGFTSHGGKRLTLSSRHLNRENIKWYHDALVKLQPTILFAYPNSAASLMLLLKQAGLSLSIPVVLASSETLSADTHKAMEDFFHCTLVNYYGQAERVCFAYSTQPGVFYFNPYYGLVELEEIPTPGHDGLRQFTIIGTGFWNRCMPLIRYDTGDYLFLPREYGAKELKEICLGLRPFSGIAGRNGEYVVTKDGAKIIGLNHISREVKHISKAQLVQTSHTAVELRVLALPGFGEADAQQLLAQTRAKLPNYFEVTIDTTQQPYTTARGKMPFVVNRIGM